MDRSHSIGCEPRLHITVLLTRYAVPKRPDQNAIKSIYVYAQSLP